MTTVAWDGYSISSDTLAVGGWGLKEKVSNKIVSGPDYFLAGAGEHAAIIRYVRESSDLNLQGVIDKGYPNFKKDDDDPSILIVERIIKPQRQPVKAWRHISGIFVELECDFFAIGSGRDYALAAMACGKSTADAVRIAMMFDNSTGGDVITHKCMPDKYRHA